MAFKGYEYINDINARIAAALEPAGYDENRGADRQSTARSIIAETHDLYPVSWSQIERDPALQSRLSEDCRIVEIGISAGRPALYGPFRVDNVGQMRLANPVGKTFMDMLRDGRFFEIRERVDMTAEEMMDDNAE